MRKVLLNYVLADGNFNTHALTEHETKTRLCHSISRSPKSRQLLAHMKKALGRLSVSAFTLW